ncbi:unnamed protein product [Xylocopa violacea]|uniref:MADF domain-containing protein n=1 Tax=Xylocopa violacea TaxID=135666 RepID=A0ABP1MZ36_XYLVO
MKCSMDMLFTLVRLYKSKEIFWNPHNPEYHQEDKLNDAWQELATELSTVTKKPVLALECKKSMDALFSALQELSDRKV